MSNQNEVSLTAEQARWVADDMKRQADRMLRLAGLREDPSNPEKIVAKLLNAKRIDGYERFTYDDGSTTEIEAIEWSIITANWSNEVEVSE